MASAEIPFALCDFNCGNLSRTANATWSHRISTANPYWLNLFHINADQMDVALANLGKSFFANHYNIGFWHWETPDFPDKWLSAFATVDEVWVPSQFVLDSISAKAPCPVIRMPHAIRFDVNSENVTRASFGLPHNSFLFLAMSDLRSGQFRKNPVGAIAAFRQAFPKPENIGLVIKINNGASDPDEIRQLRAYVNDMPNVFVIDRTLSRQDTYNLEAVCDCFVSLHRAEGFGLGLAESMFLGKPVIGTNWSGNRDFMNPTNSCPVNYQLVSLKRDCGPYAAGHIWAEPDLDHAAWYMRQLVENQSWRQWLAANGQQTIRTEFAPETVGGMYRRRLGTLIGQLRANCPGRATSSLV
jgi:glycosyltransferase involved in cell wall biosynthesis